MSAVDTAVSAWTLQCPPWMLQCPQFFAKFWARVKKIISKIQELYCKINCEDGNLISLTGKKLFKVLWYPEFDCGHCSVQIDTAVSRLKSASRHCSVHSDTAVSTLDTTVSPMQNSPSPYIFAHSALDNQLRVAINLLVNSYKISYKFRILFIYAYLGNWLFRSGRIKESLVQQIYQCGKRVNLIFTR